MFKFIAALMLALIAAVAAKPGLVAPLAYTAPAAAVYSTEYHGRFASPYVAAPYVASPYVSSPYVASPYVASPYVASPYAAAYTSPLLLKK